MQGTLLMFGLSEKHTKFEKIFFMVWKFTNVQSMRKIGQIFVCFSECPNFIARSGKYNFEFLNVWIKQYLFLRKLFQLNHTPIPLPWDILPKSRRMIIDSQLNELLENCLKTKLQYARHYNPRFEYLLPHFWSPFFCFQGSFFEKQRNGFSKSG